MSVAFWCVLAGGLMPLLWTGIAKFTGERKLGPKDNLNPRDWLERREGVQKRAHWAQLNAFEAFPLFAAAVIIAHLAGATAARIDLLAVLWVVLRLIYGILYLADKGQARTIVWSAALLCVIGLFVSAA